MDLWHLWDLTLSLTLLTSLPSDRDHLEKATATFVLQLDEAIKRLRSGEESEWDAPGLSAGLVKLSFPGSSLWPCDFGQGGVGRR